MHATRTVEACNEIHHYSGYRYVMLLYRQQNLECQGYQTLYYSSLPQGVWLHQTNSIYILDKFEFNYTLSLV